MTVKYTKLETLAQDIAKGFVGIAGLQATIETNRIAMVKLAKGRKFKTAKQGGAEVIRFREELEKAGKAEQTIKNYCTTFLKGLNENKPFSFNPYRAKGSQAGKAGGKEVKNAIKISLSGEPDEGDIAKAFRGFINKLKGNDKYASLASFMIDALDEYDGE